MISVEAATKSAGAREGLRHAAADHVHLVVQPEMIDGAAALPAEDAEAMGIVEHGEAPVFLGDFGEFGQARDVAFHRVNALDHEHLGHVLTHRPEHLAQIVRAVVAEALDRGHREPDAVPEARVDVFVGEDDVALLGKRRHARKAGEITGDVDVAGLAPEEVGEFFLQLDVVGARPVRGAGAGRAGAPLEHRGAPGLDDLGVKRKPEVVVAGEHDCLLAVQPDRRALLRLHGVVVGRVFEPHLRRVVIAAAGQQSLLVFREK